MRHDRKVVNGSTVLACVVVICDKRRILVHVLFQRFCYLIGAHLLLFLKFARGLGEDADSVELESQVDRHDKESTY